MLVHANTLCRPRLEISLNPERKAASALALQSRRERLPRWNTVSETYVMQVTGIFRKRQLQTVLTIWLKSCLEFFASQLGQVG